MTKAFSASSRVSSAGFPDKPEPKGTTQPLPNTVTPKRSPPKRPQSRAIPTEQRLPQVVNKRASKAGPEAVYIGRPGKWGNPFSIGRDGTRDEVIEKHRQWLLKSTLMDELHELRGKDLICWCAPLRCHGDILLDLANGGTRYLATEVVD